jgi:hypothetical protein
MTERINNQQVQTLVFQTKHIPCTNIRDRQNK